MALQGFSLALAILNFLGSSLSCLGALFILLCYLVLPVRRHFRHLLIINLAISDFVNGLNNGISGGIVLFTGRQLTASTACVVNGFVGQVSVQATDCSILAIAVVTVTIITRDSWLGMSKQSKNRFVLCICACTWILPFTTGIFALAKNYYVPVSGSWCWLTKSPTYLRYVLTHAWRFLFIFIEICLYIYLYIYVRKRYQGPQLQGRASLASITIDSPRRQDIVIEQDTKIGSADQGFKHPLNVPVKLVPPKPFFLLNNRRSSSDSSSLRPSAIPVAAPTPPATFEHKQRQMSRVLLLNAYPIAYIILWMPGLCNRLVEASGNSSQALILMSASTQYVGFMNALTYGWNENVADIIRTRFSNWKQQWRTEQVDI